MLLSTDISMSPNVPEVIMTDVEVDNATVDELGPLLEQLAISNRPRVIFVPSPPVIITSSVSETGRPPHVDIRAWPHPGYRPPHVDDATLDAILSHTLKAWDIYKLDHIEERRTFIEHLRATTYTTCPTPSWVAEYPETHTLFRPLFEYFAVLGEYVPEMKELGRKYAGDLKTIASPSMYAMKREAVLEYHMKFFEERCKEMREGRFDGWTKIDTKLLWRMRQMHG
ncbi:hypothetical protein NEOLEDRAFT_1137727 [Neolentinus lepideus HHB14362 ss-1]|uniref:Uncharacterized protein n=1 Tax=Neolentinus lepideus HHB14362 ss-1 TaxID=1314782 RepID=A0A165QPB7_9AGAM|nr:hypothetical protein NEOLEDRAFT_1137727 [Neolentinus lepideus HHB14362 ss-1]